MATLTVQSETVLTDEILVRCLDRAPRYDQENAFFTEDFNELRDAGYLLLPVPTEFGGRGMNLLEVMREQRRLAYYAAPTALAINMHLYWVGVAADLWRAGDDSLRWVLEEAARGHVFAAGHAESGNDIPVLLSTSTAERVDGGYRFTGHKSFGSLTPVWTYMGLHGMDMSDPANPKRIGAAADSNFSYWHSATFNNDGTKLLFSDEWGGGTAPKCRVTDKPEWGADAIFTLANGKMDFKSYYKLPAPQTSTENCVAHNGSLIPIPGRDVMAQAWYQGGISVFEWTDAAHPREIAYHDRGPTNATRLELGGPWSVYWYNGVLVSSEIQRGLDIFELVPSAFISQNEIDAAKTVRFDYLNTQGQRKLVWPPSFALARAYADQLARSNGLSTTRLGAVRQALASAETATGSQRGAALTALAATLDGDVAGSSDAAKVKMLAGAVRELAGK